MVRGTDRLTWGQGIITALFIGAVSWLSATVTQLYRESGAHIQASEDAKRLADLHNRQNDEIKANERLIFEHLLRNCGCPAAGGKR